MKGFAWLWLWEVMGESWHLTNKTFGAVWAPVIPAGKRLHNYRKSPFLMGKSTISMAIFNSYFDITRGYIQEDPDPTDSQLHQKQCHQSPAALLAEVFHRPTSKHVPWLNFHRAHGNSQGELDAGGWLQLMLVVQQILSALVVDLGGRPGWWPWDEPRAF